MPNHKQTIGLIIGSGQLTYDLLNKKNDAINPIFSIGINGVCDDETLKICDEIVGLGDIGKIIKIFKKNNIKQVAIIGYIKRPDFSKISFDLVGMKLLPKLLMASKIGDDAIMRIILNEFEENGISIMRPEVLYPNLSAKFGALGAIAPKDADFKDIEKANAILKDIGKYDIGQAIVVIDGCVAAIEAQEGTDEMLKRVALLPSHFLGNTNQKKGILLKAPKTIQDMRIDLPTIGITTLENAIKANLAGIAYYNNKAIIAQEAELIEKANEAGLFLYGLDE